MKMLTTVLGRYASFGPVFLRVLLGAGFIMHGIAKFDREGGISATGDAFAGPLGIPGGEIVAPVVGVLEIVLGLFLIAGLFTRASALVLTAILLGAVYYVKNDGFLFNGNQAGAELDLVYIAGLLSLAVTGPGALSADGFLNQDETIIDLRPANEPSTPQVEEQKAMT